MASLVVLGGSNISARGVPRAYNKECMCTRTYSLGREMVRVHQAGKSSRGGRGWGRKISECGCNSGHEIKLEFAIFRNEPARYQFIVWGY